MKVFEFSGNLHVKGNLSHQELLNILYKELTKHDIRLVGKTKDVTDKFVETEEYIRIY